jgi:hypothetical protein
MPDPVGGPFRTPEEASETLRKLKEARCGEGWVSRFANAKNRAKKDSVLGWAGPLLRWGSLASNGRAPFFFQRLTIQATSVPVAIPIKPPTATSLGK